MKGGHNEKGYWIVAYRSISDESAVKAYSALASPDIESLGGRLLTGPRARFEPTKPDCSSGLVVEFNSFDAVAAHKSEAYQKALQTLGSGAERDFRIVDGA